MFHSTPIRLRPKRLSHAVSLAVASLVASGALAQNAEPQAAPASTSNTSTTVQQDGEITKVIVSTRRSQQSSIDRKKNAATAMDSIVADDVGSLPDRNIGEAISRIAGVAISRGDFGEGTSVSIRGNGPELTRVEMDGVGVRSAGGSDMNGGGDGRATEFRQLPSELIKSVDVVKGSTADMTEGSLGGGVIIKTRTALDFDKPFVSIRAAASQNNLNKKTDPDLNVIATNKFMNGRLGVLLNASSSRVTNESHQFQVSSNGRDGYMRALDFDNSPNKTFTYHPETVDQSQAASTAPWVTYGTWNASTPLDIVTKSAAAKTKADCYTAFPVLSTTSTEIASLSSTNKTNAINARDQEIASCLNQWNDTIPSLLRYFVKRQIDDRKNLDLRVDFKVNSKLSVYGKGTYNRRKVDDNFLTYSLGNVSVNSGNFTDSAAGVRSANAGSGLYTFPYSYSLVSGKAPVSGAVANIDPASVVVDANHRVTQFTLSNASVGVDQIRNPMGTTTRTFVVGGSYKDGALSAEFLGSDMDSHFWRGDTRSSVSYAYGSGTAALQPTGIWSYTVPAGVSLNDWTRATTLQTAASATAPQYTNTLGITYNPQLRDTSERQAKLDVTYGLGDKIPFFTRVKGGLALRDTGYDNWGGGGFTVSPAVGTAGTAGYVAAVTVPGNAIRSTIVGCQNTAGSLAAGGTPCAYGLVPTANSRNYQVVLTPQQLQDAITGAMYTTATATQLFNGAKNRPDALIDNWTQLDVLKLFSSVGATNLNFDCMKTCTGSDGKVYEQPKTSIKERTQAAYLMTDFNVDHLPFTGIGLPFGWEIDGNLGWRYVRTQVHGTGVMTFTSLQLVKGVFDPTNPGAAGGYTTSSVTRNTEVRATTHDFLPVYNLAMWVVPDKAVVRYSRGKTVARPPASQLVPAGTCTYDQRLIVDGDPTGDMTCTTTGNPALRAQTNINHNLSLEYYPNKDTMLTASAYKQIGKIGPTKTDAVKAVQVFAGTDTVDPATGASLANIPFDLKTYVNDVPSTRTGVEFSMKTAFTFLPWKLRYTGLDANVTRQRSTSSVTVMDLLSGETLTPAGVAKYSFNWALWYDDGKWSARLATQVVGQKFSCIAPCGDSVSGYSLNAYPNLSLAYKNPAYNPGPANFTDRTSYVDGKIGYKFSKNLDFFIEGRNLTNQTQTGSMSGIGYANGTPNLQTYYYPGRRIAIGLNYRNL